MSSFNDNYEVRLAKKSDIDDIVKYINDNWKENHILVRDRKLFEYEFLNEDDTVNFVLGISKNTNEIEGIYGFLYTAKDKEMRDAWGSILKVREGNSPFLGIELMRQMEIQSKCRNHLAIGANPRTSVVLATKGFKRTAGIMEHFYRLSNREINDYKIADIKTDKRINVYKENNENVLIEPVICIEEVEKFLDNYKKDIPYKDTWYVNRRFLNHPIHKYNVYKISENGEVGAVFVLRTQKYNDRSAIRFLDYIGNHYLLKWTAEFWDKLFDDKDVEYIDFYCKGFDEKLLNSIGFVKRTIEDENIIPNYFSPYVKQNIDIWIHYIGENVIFCKADGDQDRPN